MTKPIGSASVHKAAADMERIDNRYVMAVTNSNLPMTSMCSQWRILWLSDASHVQTEKWEGHHEPQ